MSFLNKELYHYLLVFFNFIINIYVHVKRFINKYFDPPYIDEIIISNKTNIKTIKKYKKLKTINISQIYNLSDGYITSESFVIIKYYYNEQYYRFILGCNVINLLNEHTPNKQIFPFTFDNNIKFSDILLVEIYDNNNRAIDITDFILSFNGPHSNIYPISHIITFHDLIKTFILSENYSYKSKITLMNSDLDTHTIPFDAKLRKYISVNHYK